MSKTETKGLRKTRKPFVSVEFIPEICLVFIMTDDDIWRNTARFRSKRINVFYKRVTVLTLGITVRRRIFRCRRGRRFCNDGKDICSF